MTRSHLQVVLADGEFTTDKLALNVWTSVLTKLLELVIEHLLDGKEEQEECIPCFNSSHKLYIIAYECYFSADFLNSSVAKIKDICQGVKGKIILDNKISREPVSQIWCPKHGAWLRIILLSQKPKFSLHDSMEIKEKAQTKTSL